MTAAWAADLPAGEKLVLLALADCANDEGKCWPSVATLARKTGKSERSLQGAIRTLREGGHVSRDDRPGTSPLYTIHPRHDVQLDLPITPAETAPPQKLHPRKKVQSPPQKLRGTPAESAPKSSKNRKEPSNSRAIELPDWIPVDAWNAFAEMRKAMPKVPFTAKAAERVIAKLETLRGEGHDPEKLLLLAVERGWRSVFPTDETKAKAKPVEQRSPEEKRAFGEKLAADYERWGRPDEAAEVRRKYGIPFGKVAADIVRSANA